MSFNPDISKQAQEVIFSRKLKKTPHPPLMFNSNLVNKASSHKHLGIILEESLSFEEHLKTISVKTNKTLYLLRKLQNFLPRAALITLYKSFIRNPILTMVISFVNKPLIHLFMKNLSLSNTMLA